MATMLGPRSSDSPDRPDGAADPDRAGFRLRGDLLAVALAAALVTASSVVGWALKARGVDVLVGWPPLLAEWLPHVGPGTVPAIVLALLVALRGPEVARAMSWRPLLVLATVVSIAWTFSLAMIDGWFRGIAGRLATPTEYLQELPLDQPLTEWLSDFARRIPSFQPDSLVTHASGHPPLATLFYMGLDEIGMGSGGRAGFVTLVIGATAVAAVAITVAALGDRDTARRYLPFGVLFPGAVWVGVSADGMFMAVFAWGVALLALGAVRSHWSGHLLCVLGGTLLGAGLFLNYGLVLGALLPIAVAVVVRRWTPLVSGLIGTFLVVGLFAWGGFWWYEGYEMVQIRYYQPGEYGQLRPYYYWVWANFGAVLLALGPAVVAGVRRVTWRPRSLPPAVVALAAAGLGAILVATLSGLSKSEVERIWLPFAVWIVVATAVLPRVSARWWLLGQAALALAVNHLLLTTW